LEDVEVSSSLGIRVVRRKASRRRRGHLFMCSLSATPDWRAKQMGRVPQRRAGNTVLFQLVRIPSAKPARTAVLVGQRAVWHWQTCISWEGRWWEPEWATCVSSLAYPHTSVPCLNVISTPTSGPRPLRPRHRLGHDLWLATTEPIPCAGGTLVTRCLTPNAHRRPQHFSPSRALQPAARALTSAAHTPRRILRRSWPILGSLRNSGIVQSHFIGRAFRRDNVRALLTLHLSSPTCLC
jgi:hypothetical protein